MLRGLVAQSENDSTLLRQSYREFLQNYDAEVGTHRQEYIDHIDMLDDFRARALAAVGR